MLDAGICGYDWIVENGADVVEVRGAASGSRLGGLAAVHAPTGSPMEAPYPPSPAAACQVCELPYSKATSKPACWVLAVPESSPVQQPEDLAGTIVASELVNTTRRCGAGRGGSREGSAGMYGLAGHASHRGSAGLPAGCCGRHASWLPAP